MSDKLQEQAQELMKSGKVSNAVVQNGKVMVTNQITGNEEEYHGQAVQDPSGNYLGRKEKS